MWFIRLEQFATSLPHPGLQHVTTLHIFSGPFCFGFPDVYPAVLLPNATRLHLTFHRSFNDAIDCFACFTRVLPGINPTQLVLETMANYNERDERSSLTFGCCIHAWTRLRTIVFAYCYTPRGSGPTASIVMDGLLHDSVALLEGVSTIEVLKPKVVFDWRFLENPTSNEFDPVEEPVPSFSLASLPSWMEFEIVIDSKSSWLKKDRLEEWLDEYCGDEEMRDRIVVLEVPSSLPL